MTGSGGGGTGVQANGSSSNECIASWLELESDPGLFTLLVDDFGVKGVQVEEVYDLTKPLDKGRRNKSSSLEASSNYVTDSNIVNKMFFAHQVPQTLFFFGSVNIVPNSCATHALLSVLLNCKLNKYLDLGELLEKFKKICDGMAPEIKGLAIGNQPRLAQAHNSYAKPDPNRPNYHHSYTSSKHYGSSMASSSSLASSSSPSSSSINSTNLIHLSSSSANNFTTNSSLLATTNSSQVTVTMSNNELFHFICFVPINGRLYELDGLKPYPVDHGPIHSNNSSSFNSQLLEQLLLQFTNNENTSNFNLQQVLSNLTSNYLSTVDPSYFNWTNKFKQIILQRLSSFNNGQQNHEIRFNLMAVVPDKMLILKEQIDLINENKMFINKSLLDLPIKFENENVLSSATSTSTVLVSSCLSSTLSSQSPPPPLTPQQNTQTDNDLNNSENQNNNNNNNKNSINNNMTPDFLNAPRQLRSSKTNSSNQLATSQQLNITNSKKLPNGNSNSNLTNSTQQSMKPEDKLQYEIIFNLTNHDTINDLITNLKSSTKINFIKFKQDLAKLIEKFDFIELSKVFKIEKISPSSIITSSVSYSHMNGSTNNGTESNLFHIKKLVSINELRQAELKLTHEIESDQSKYNEEIDKRKKYRIEALRRKHIYDEFILTYLKILAENGKLEEIVKNSLAGRISTNVNTTSTQPLTTTAPSASTSTTNNTTTTNGNSSFYISPSSLFLQQPFSKKQRKK